MIREATEEDMPKLIEMAKRLHLAAHFQRWASVEDSEPGWEGWIRRCAAHDDAICLVAESEEGAPVGFVTAFSANAFWNPSVSLVQVASTWVEPEYRGNGLGKNLLSAVKEWGESLGARMAAASSWQTATPKIIGSVLRGLGFRMQEQHYVAELGDGRAA